MKRGDSGLSFVVGIDKDPGMSSHDVVARCRRIFHEKRIGHAGTLDPAATGVLLVCVGSAARLDKYLTGHDKCYRVEIAFGASTSTDDAEGEILQTAAVPDALLDEAFARIHLAMFEGPQKQVPPAYSAIKVGGKKACDEARKGNEIELAARDVEIYSAELVSLTDMRQTSTPYVVWTVDLHVSKGTYVRSFARDLGIAIDCPAHVLTLERTQSGTLKQNNTLALPVLECVVSGIEEENAGQKLVSEQLPALDPIPLLGYRFAFVDDEMAARVKNGNHLAADAFELYRDHGSAEQGGCDCCTGFARATSALPEDGELISVLHGRDLIAMYCFDKRRGCWKSDCVLQPPVYRGDIR